MRLEHVRTGAQVNTSKGFAERRSDRWRQPGAEPPNVSDKKGKWVAYAKTQGYDPAEGLTKQQLIDEYG